MIIKPRFLRMVGAHRANDFSFGMAFHRGDIPKGCFGSIPPWEDESGEPSWSAADEGYDWHHNPAFKAVRRRSIHRNPNYRKSA